MLELEPAGTALTQPLLAAPYCPAFEPTNRQWAAIGKMRNSTDGKRTVNELVRDPDEFRTVMKPLIGNGLVENIKGSILYKLTDLGITRFDERSRQLGVVPVCAPS